MLLLIYKSFYLISVYYLFLIESSIDEIENVLMRFTVNDNKKIIIIRLFLTTSKAYRDYRITNSSFIQDRVFFSQASYPKFIWVCEYGTAESFKNHTALGEFVIDATAEKNMDPVISIRHAETITYRGPNDPVEYAEVRRDITLSHEFAMYMNNLKLTN